MTKASEYAALHAAAEKMRPAEHIAKDANGDRVLTALVRADGHLLLMCAGQLPHLPPADAINLAYWILATFGEAR